MMIVLPSQTQVVVIIIIIKKLHMYIFIGSKCMNVIVDG
jgi:hypothetical protein